MYCCCRGLTLTSRPRTDNDDDDEEEDNEYDDAADQP